MRDTVKCSFGQILSVVKWKDLEFHEGGKHMDLICHSSCPMAPAQGIPKGIYGSVVTFFLVQHLGHSTLFHISLCYIKVKLTWLVIVEKIFLLIKCENKSN